MWFAFKLVSLNHWKQPYDCADLGFPVVICFQISIFEPLETTEGANVWDGKELWFAFKLVSLNHWKQLYSDKKHTVSVVICFQISIFEPLETTPLMNRWTNLSLWFAFKLVSLNHWKQQDPVKPTHPIVVICFQISIFEPLETTMDGSEYERVELWFAFKLVSLNHWKQLNVPGQRSWRSCDLLSN